MKNRLTAKERVTIWNSYTDEQKEQLKRIKNWLNPEGIYKIERW